MPRGVSARRAGDSDASRGYFTNEEVGVTRGHAKNAETSVATSARRPARAVGSFGEETRTKRRRAPVCRARQRDGRREGRGRGGDDATTAKNASRSANKWRKRQQRLFVRRAISLPDAAAANLLAPPTWRAQAGVPVQTASGTSGYVHAGRRVQRLIGPAAAAFGSPRCFSARSCRASRVPCGCIEENGH